MCVIRGWLLLWCKILICISQWHLHHSVRYVRQLSCGTCIYWPLHIHKVAQLPRNDHEAGSMHYWVAQEIH